MQFKLIVTMVQDDKVDKVLKAAREAGATGATVITNARGEGRQPLKTFFGLELTIQRDMVLLVVEDSMSRRILETISEVAELDETPGTGIAVQIAIEDAIGLASQIKQLSEKVED
jgi:nitrogen regulatory protein PII